MNTNTIGWTYPMVQGAVASAPSCRGSHPHSHPLRVRHRKAGPGTMVGSLAMVPTHSFERR